MPPREFGTPGPYKQVNLAVNRPSAVKTMNTFKERMNKMKFNLGPSPKAQSSIQKFSTNRRVR